MTPVIRHLKQLSALALVMALSACSLLPTEPQDEAAPISDAAPQAEAQDPNLPPLETPRGLAPLSRQVNTDSSAVAPALPSADLWDRIRDGYAMVPLDNALVDKWTRFYATRPDYIQRMTLRSEKYLYYIVQALHERQMPTELALLPFIESAFNPEALSRAKAAGMWQFIPSTGRHFKLTQNALLDERRDVLESTKAALDDLESLHKMFGDWSLALAAYNWGEGSVQRAIKRNKARGLPTDYSSLRMPKETRNYVPKLMAFRAIVATPEAFQVKLPTVPNHPFFDIVRITQDIDVSVAARLASISEDEFRALNPSLKHPVILAAGLPRILLPWENAALFSSNLDRHDQALATWTAWRVPQTANPAKLAQQVGMSEAELRRVNGIPRGRVVTQGSVLVVRRTAQVDRDAPESIANSANLGLRWEAGTGSVRVRRGDTLSRIAQRHGISTTALAQANGISTRSIIRIGQRLRVPGRGGAATAVADGPSQVRIRPGDTLSRIASRHGVSTRALARANGLSLRSTLRIGQVLRIPGRSASAARAEPSSTATSSGASVRVRSGDTLSEIASRHGTNASALARANGISTRSTLRVGQSLRLPQGASEQAATPPKTQGAKAARSSTQVRVRSGDTLSEIAGRHGISASTLARANGISTRSTLRVGQVLQVPAQGQSASATRPSHVRVQRGDTLYELAKLYGVSVQQLAQANGISHRSTLRIGQRLRLPQ